MQISKHLHSCLLVKDQDKTALIDPGSYTYEQKALPLDTLSQLDYLLITHEHPDHFSLPLVRELVAKFPDVTIITNPSIVSILEKEQIKATNTDDTLVQLEHVPHEKLWDKEVPDHVIINVFNKLTHAGDSLHFSKTADVLALPLQAPWGSTMQAVTKALEIKPKVIIPIHDWHWKDDIRIALYKRLEPFFAKENIAFKCLETGEIIAV